jgi:hypothetical protein
MKNEYMNDLRCPKDAATAKKNHTKYGKSMSGDETMFGSI